MENSNKVGWAKDKELIQNHEEQVKINAENIERFKHGEGYTYMDEIKLPHYNGIFVHPNHTP